MATKEEIALAIRLSLDGIVNTVQEAGGDAMASHIKVRNDAVVSGTTFPMDESAAKIYADNLRRAFSAGVLEVFEDNAWRTAFVDAITEGIALQSGNNQFGAPLLAGIPGRIAKFSTDASQLVSSQLSEEGGFL